MRCATARLSAAACSGAMAFASLDRLVEGARHHGDPMGRDRRRGSRVILELGRNRGGDGARQRAARRQEDGAGSGVVLGLGDQIRRDPVGIAVLGHDDDLRRPGVEVDGAVGRHAGLGGGDVGVAGTDDLVHARHRRRAVGQCGDGVRAAEAEEPVHPGFHRRREHGRGRVGAGRDHLADPRRACRDRRHQERRRQRVPPAGHVAADPLERRHALLDHHAGRDRHAPALRDLPGGHPADVARRVPNGPADGRRRQRGAAPDLVRVELERSLQPVERPCVLADRAVAAPPHGVDDLRHAGRHVGVGGPAPLDQRPHRPPVGGRDDLHRTLIGRSCSAGTRRSRGPRRR